MTNHSFEVYPFRAYDGFGCNLWRLKNDAVPTRGPVLLVHGAGVSSNIFNPPQSPNLLDLLARAGYDVWLENWRGSTAFAPNAWDLDIVAENDHPVAVREVCRLTGATTLKAIIHCQGSTSFMISACRGYLPQVDTILSNAVSLHPVVPAFSVFKLDYLLPMLRPFTGYLNPHWAVEAPTWTARAIRALVMLSHREADTPVGKMVSFTYGAGHPALWELDNLAEETRTWITGEFGPVPLSFFTHIRRCVRAGVLVSRDGSRDYGQQAGNCPARLVFFTGRRNKCFLPDSQERSYDFFEKLRPGFHRLYAYADYSHLDIFFGRNSAEDIFPTMVKELNS